MMISKIIVILVPLIMLIVLIDKSLPLLQDNGFLNILSGNEWKPGAGSFGFKPFIIGSLYVSILAILISAPVCILAAIYLSEYAHRKILSMMQPVIDILAGIPSVIYGVWGILFIVPFVRNVIAPAMGIESTGYSILAGSLVLAVMTIPFILNILLELFATVPRELRESAYSMGTTKWEMVKVTVLRKTGAGIISAVGLGWARAIGETIAVMMVVGNTIVIPDSIVSPGYPLPALIANNYGEMMSIPKYDSALMFAALILLAITVIFNILMRMIIRRFTIKPGEHEA
ncbi:MAG TPA: phosphate ABC transporter permease subunit PstC [Bacteroidales bacterium]|nr:phosphate ABC transporter permease subunit PstC [Bacteroidales bacterium]HCB62502.1 phosphate ABC transporter permease subunit PstC [Bacteroidales bacterium]HCY21957.1 phosphate ABC transporter permease subunit PstC [Bacteroidales bacterium]